MGQSLSHGASQTGSPSLLKIMNNPNMSTSRTSHFPKINQRERSWAKLNTLSEIWFVIFWNFFLHRPYSPLIERTTPPTFRGRMQLTELILTGTRVREKVTMDSQSKISLSVCWSRVVVLATRSY